MGNCTLDWHPDRGFELELELADGELSIRFANVPVNADGTAELERGVDLDRLDILFKANVEVQGDPAQLLDARIVLIRQGQASLLQLDARCEDVETGSIIPFQGRVPVSLPSGVPTAGGPRPVPTNEDDLDWDDETTLEQLVVKAPESTGRNRLPREDEEEDPDSDPEPTPLPTRAPNSGAPAGGAPATKPRGLQALLQALSQLDADDDEAEEASDPSPVTPSRPGHRTGSSPPAKAVNRKVTAAPLRAAPPPPEPEEGDQSLGAKGEARKLLDLMLAGENLELEDDTDLDELASGVASILALPGSSERKATRLSEWLLNQEGVADLFIGDDDLAELLERW